MSINIKGATGNTSQNAVRKSGKSNKSGESSTPSAPSSEDSVELTSTATELQKIEQSLSNIPVVDDARVQAISESISQGDYKINKEKIADVIISSEKTLIK